MDSIITKKWLEIQLAWTIQVSALIILVLQITQKMIQQLSRQLLQLSALDRRLFANTVEELDTKIMPGSSLELTSYRQVLEEILTSSTHFMLMKQMIHQESGTSKLQQFTSNTGPLLPKPVLCFCIS